MDKVGTCCAFIFAICCSLGRETATNTKMNETVETNISHVQPIRISMFPIFFKTELTFSISRATGQTTRSASHCWN